MKIKLKESNSSFSGVSFEKKIPYEMRFKEYNDTDEGDSLYWITQQHYTKEDLNKFAEALKDTPYTKAYVVVRDNSTYNLGKDTEKGVLDIVSLEQGKPTIYFSGENKIEESEEQTYEIMLSNYFSNNMVICEWPAESEVEAIEEFTKENPSYADGKQGKITARLKKSSLKESKEIRVDLDKLKEMGEQVAKEI